MFSYLSYFQKVICTITLSEDGAMKKVRLLFKVTMLIVVRYMLNMIYSKFFMECLMILNRKVMLGEAIHFKGLTFYVNDYLSLYILSPYYEGQVFIYLFKEIKSRLRLKDKIVMIDVGAHIGKYAVLLAKYFPSLRIIAIEPCPQNMLTLMKNIRVNCLKNVIPLKVACTDIDGKTELYISFKSGNHSIKETPEAVTKITIEGRSLDGIVNELMMGGVDIIKIDVEGAEGDVLNGSIETLKTYKPIIFLEIRPENYQTVSRTLRSLHYNITEIEGINYIAKPENA